MRIRTQCLMLRVVYMVVRCDGGCDWGYISVHKALGQIQVGNILLLIIPKQHYIVVYKACLPAQDSPLASYNYNLADASLVNCLQTN
jgi:hypothetical protein